ncbi:MAG: C40 family peptidase [Marmoricola sp.]|nr:C40 family peptidase [Marmoricola sp.]
MPASRPRSLRHLFTLPLIALAVLGATLVAGPVSSASAASTSAISRATDVALSKIGDHYRYGAAGPGAFDCSGLVYYSFRKAGIHNVPRTASAQAHRARHISKHSLRRGDLMFFTSGGHVYHVAIFLRWVHGRALLLHSPRPGQRVKKQRVWTSSWFAGTLRG